MATQPELLNEGIGIGGEVPHEVLIETNGHLTVRYSPTLGKLAGALAKAQQAFKPIKKQVENAFYSTDRKKAMYADLAAIIEATQRPLAENDLVIIQAPITKPELKQAGVVSRLMHSSGEWHECELLLPAVSRAKRWTKVDGKDVQVEYEKFDAQTIGAATMYARRYTYGPQIGVAAEEDDDANSIGEAAANGSKEAAQAVANRKINEHVAKKVTETGKVPAIFYSWQDDEQKAYITGEVALLSANKELLQFKAKWSSKANAFITDDVGLEDLKFELHERGVLFIPAKGQELTAALQESIVQEKKKKAQREPGDDAK